MAEIGHGYGSEYQLLRFLGHHRHYFEKQIREAMKTNEDIYWFDYPVNTNKLSLDGEYKGISFLENHPNYTSNKEKWEQFWATTGNQPNWDAIFKIGKKYVLVEAKAHVDEIISSSGAGEKSLKIIEKAFNKTKEHFGITTSSNWMKTYYQLANRVAFLYFMNVKCKIETHLLNIYFLNGYIRRIKAEKGYCVIENKSIADKVIWEREIDKEYDYLGLTDSKAEKYIHSVFIDCLSKQDIV
jgi:hypothetical protein